MNATPKTVAVLGPGGVGGFVGALLARAGHRVICLAGADTAGVLSRDGLSVTSARYGDFTVPVAAGTELTEPVDACLIAVKETALEAACDRVPPDVLGSGTVVPFLNGIEHVARLRERYPAEQVAAATIMVESTRVAPGRIEHTSPFAAMDLAGATVPGERLAATGELLADSGMRVTVREDEEVMLWDKFALLAPHALLATRYGTPVGGLRTDRRAELRAVLDEITGVARVGGSAVEAEQVLAAFDRMPAGTKPSMLRDAEAGRPLELEAIGGALLRAAERYGVEVPLTSRIVAELRAR
ncbi:2-dehydropantoate 2-reductase [Streptomyces sp. NPDC047108]|uniref:ketopantoate reductase family protein n=1 Tax=Streptomyces sp. NPDC047108 TaxID=3155025 RepID=UPI0033EF3B31